MGKKQKKPGKGKEKTERKTAKSTEKRARRDEKKISEEDDIDLILAKIRKEEAKKCEIHIDENVSPPSPRCNCSVTINPLKDNELIIYGGEYYNGDKMFVYGDLYRYNVEKNEFKLISSPNSPPPRSAHQAVAWKNWLFIFGGEFTSPNQERFHHYKDLWRLDLNTNAWEQLNLKGCPSARSGHRMALYKHKLVLFGGFYDTLREVRYYNDLHVLDLDDYKWQEIKPKPGAAWPSPRSGFQFATFFDEVFLYGGYFKDNALAEKDGSEKGVALADLWSLDPRTWDWSKVKKIGMPPGPRAGLSMCIHKKRMILFGGVVDMEDKGDVLHSTFLNEMYSFQMDNRRWYPLELRNTKVSKNKLNGRKQKYDESQIEFEDGPDQILDDLEEVSLKEDQAIRPCGRINCAMVVGRDTLYLYGGMKEVGDQEVTLDDLYSLDLNKLDSWKCIIEATKTDWVEATEEDDEDDDDDSDDDDEDDDNDDEDDNEEDDKEDESDDTNHETLMEGIERSSASLIQEAAAVLRGEGKKLHRKERKAKINKMRAELGLADSQRTPLAGETLKDFFLRTNIYWQMAAYEHTQHTGKELRKDGFDLAEARYKELRPVLDELSRLEAEQKVEEELAASASIPKKREKGKSTRHQQ